VIFSSLLAGLTIFILEMKFFSRLVFGWVAVLLILNLSLWRAIKRIIIRYRIAKGYYNINVLIIGAGKAGYALAEEIEENPYLGLKVIGLLDDNKTGKVLSYKVLGKINDLEHIVQHSFIDEIYITIPSERKRVSEILTLVRGLKKTIRILVDNFMPLETIGEQEKSKTSLAGFTFPFSQVKMNYIGFIPLISYIDVGLHPTELFAKRLLDVIVAGISLILLMPLFVIIAFLIKLDSPGSVFYQSLRCGKKGRLFNFYKFRSMFQDSDNQKEVLRNKSEVKGPVFKIKNDPRITFMGRLLRRYSLDELPQLLNVLKGDISLVGPRPPTPDEVAKYDFWQMRRLEIRPGITCLWQVRGRSDLSFYKWVKWDLWYINNWSFGLDLKILWWTIPAILKRKGAY
jgi:exopolysaccharide biosynthesis polyprenyl glycosylphosphotransferase